MQFILIAHDYPDALPRRMAVREKHLAQIEAMKATGQVCYAVALLNDKGEMAGSVTVFELPDRTAIEQYLKTEPYVTGNVWEKIDVRPCRIGPAFLKPPIA